MSSLVYDKVIAPLAEAEEFYEKCREIACCSESADKGRIIAALEKLKAELEAAKAEQRLVAEYYRVKAWGYLVNNARKGAKGQLQEALPDIYTKVPTSWRVANKKASHNKLEKELREIWPDIEEALAYIVKHEAEEGSDYANEARSNLEKLFTESTSAEELRAEIRRILFEEDPSDEWVRVVDYAKDCLLGSSLLPSKAVKELLVYAELNDVEIKYTEIASLKESSYEENRWFNYLLCTRLLAENRPDWEQVHTVSKDLNNAAKYGELFSLFEGYNPDRPKIKMTAWDQRVDLNMLCKAYSTYVRILMQNPLINDFELMQAISTEVWGKAEASSIKHN